MPLPMFPTEEGAPGDGSLIAVYGGASTEVIGGLIQRAQVVETDPQGVANIPTPTGRFGEPLMTNGVTIWISGSLLLDVRGQPSTSDYADMLSRWTTVRDKLKLIDYELFVYYRTASPATYRKFKTVNTAILRSYWSNPVTLSYVLAGVTTDKTLYETEPGA